MRSSLGLTHRTMANILFVIICFATFGYSDISAQTDLQNKQGNETMVENRFIAFKKKLQKNIDERIATIVSWMPNEPSDRFAVVIASVRDPMIEDLKQIQNQFIDEINRKPLKTVIQESLINDPAVDAQVDKYFHDANARLMAQYYKSRAELASLLSSERSSPKTQKTIETISGIALLLFITGVALLIYRSRQPKNEPAEPARLVRGTTRSIIALASIYIIFILALLDYLVRQRSSNHLTAVLVGVIILYFVSRAIDAAYTARAGFTFFKTFPDGTKERLQSHEQPEAQVKETLMHLHATIEKLTQTVQELQKHK